MLYPEERKNCCKFCVFVLSCRSDKQTITLRNFLKLVLEQIYLGGAGHPVVWLILNQVTSHWKHVWSVSVCAVCSAVWVQDYRVKGFSDLRKSLSTDPISNYDWTLNYSTQSCELSHVRSKVRQTEGTCLPDPLVCLVRRNHRARRGQRCLSQIPFQYFN